MSEFSPITLNTKVYAPSDMNSGAARWMERGGGVATSFSPLTLRVVSPAAGVKNYRVKSNLLVPVVATDDSTCGCEGTFLRQIAGEITVTISQMSTAAEREDFYLRLVDYVASDAFKNAIEDLEPVAW